MSVLIHLAQTYKVHDAGNEPISNCIILDSEQMTYNGNVTEYVYAATGEKLRVKHTMAVEGLSVPLGQTLELTTAMRMNVDKGVTDYQGNVRLVVDGNGTIEQRNDYYAYGGPWGDNAINQGFQPFKYNGKELDRMHGLDWYDYGARMYDPAMGLFTQVDLLAEQYPHLNPYMYCAGNPVKYVDPDGKSIWTKLIKGTVKISKQVVKHGVKALGETATYATAVADIVDDVNVLTDSEAPTGDRIWAGVSLASEFLPVSINDAKDVGKILRNQKKIPYNGGLAKPHGGKRHNAEIDRYIDNISVDPEVSHIRKNQKQVDFRGQTVGDNRPDIQYDKGNKNYNVELTIKNQQVENTNNVLATMIPMLKIYSLLCDEHTRF
ncbi:MAG: RHS repeat-associated core domain-containing protein [Bacteroidaceae bacterium]|nr:RHS repeat-associated core domain-containing protein [Bacteroidaceae bacterium]